jgi:phosphatidate cytidylyltransferase
VTRVLSGAVLLVVAIGVVWFAPPLLFFFVAELLVVIGCAEYSRLARASQLRVSSPAAALIAAAVCASFARVALGGSASISLDLVLMLALLVTCVTALVSWRGGGDAVASTAAVVFPALYLGVPLGALIVIRDAGGPEGLFLLMLTIVVSDTAQYYSGRALGRRPLARRVSPKKTVEGAVGGLIFGAALMTGLGAWWLPQLSLIGRMVLGVAVVAFGIAGDLFESMLKRSAGVKDSSSLIPGHGGILDRIDALLFAAPVYYIVVRFV